MKLIALIAMVAAFNSAFALDFSDIPVAKTVEESKRFFELRKQKFIDNMVERDLGPFSAISHNNFGLPGAARAYTGEKMDEVNQILEQPGIKPYAKVGTKISILGGLCKRNGDYDFQLQHLIRLIYSDIEGPQKLSELAYTNLRDKLISVRGKEKYLKFSLGLCGVHRDTENHILMTESSRFLNNQLLLKRDDLNVLQKHLYDNSKNGFSQRMLKDLQHFMKVGFEEFNSRPYQGYTVLALNNLQSYSDDPKVQLAAEMVLDFLSATFAVQSQGGRRYVPFRRQPKYASNPDIAQADAEMGRFAMLAGNHEYVKGTGNRIPYGSHFAFGAAVAKYRVPDMILDLMIRKDHNKYVQYFNHDAIELYASSKNYLISGGGKFRDFFDMGTKEQDAWARPTTIFPAKEMSNSIHDYIRINGNKHRMSRSNLCLMKNFACGANVVIPNNIPRECIKTGGHFNIINLDENCSLNYGIRVAVYKRKCESRRCRSRGSNYGFYEVREADEISADEFTSKVFENVGMRCPSQKHCVYKTTDGNSIEFQPLPWRMHTSSIVKYNGQAIERNTNKWPFAYGSVINSKGDGLITVDNHFLGKRLTLDMRDHLNPKKTITDL